MSAIKPLSEYSIEELQAQIERIKSSPPPIPPPTPKSHPNFEALYQCVLKGVERSFKDRSQDENLKQYVYEHALEAVYGEEYWKWRNAQGW